MAEWLAVFIAAWALWRSSKPRTLAMNGTGPLAGTSLSPRPTPEGTRLYTTPPPAPTVASVQGPATLAATAPAPSYITMAGALAFQDMTPAKAYIELSKAIYHRNFALYGQIRRDFEV